MIFSKTMHDDYIAAGLTAYAKQYRVLLKVKINRGQYPNKESWNDDLKEQTARLAGMEMLLKAMSLTDADIWQIQHDAEGVFWQKIRGE